MFSIFWFVIVLNLKKKWKMVLRFEILIVGPGFKIWDFEIFRFVKVKLYELVVVVCFECWLFRNIVVLKMRSHSLENGVVSDFKFGWKMVVCSVDSVSKFCSLFKLFVIDWFEDWKREWKWEGVWWDVN